ncbi:MAG TPA: hypothetical protein VHQ90_17380 [Thermoanaerobaculia bacterium]|nr:hypothetical protein [Thermoanaerobaculia bacterium]
MTDLRNRDFIGLRDFTADELNGLLALAARMKSNRDRTPLLAGTACP